MASYYLDTSALVKRYVTERGTAWIVNLTDPSSGHELWTVRLAAALHVELAHRAVQLPLAFLTADAEQLRVAQIEGLAGDNPNNYP